MSVIILSILGCWLAETPGLLCGAALGCLLDDAIRAGGGQC